MTGLEAMPEGTRDSGDPRLVRVALDEATIVRRREDIEHERRVAIADLLEGNLFRPKVELKGNHLGPYHLQLRLEEDRLAFDLADQSDEPLGGFTLALKPFKRIIKEYFIICESYFTAIKTSNLRQVEALDMGRRSLHDEGSELLRNNLEKKAEVDFDTARRLFTLVCVLNMRG